MHFLASDEPAMLFFIHYSFAPSLRDEGLILNLHVLQGTWSLIAAGDILVNAIPIGVISPTTGKVFFYYVD